MKRTRRQRGVTILVVLVLMSVMLLGGLALARMTEVGTLASGNAAYKESAMQASEIGLNTVFAQVRAIVDEDTAQGVWYAPTPRATDVHGIPNVDFDTAPLITVGNYQVRYVAERMCVNAAVADPLRECLVKQEPQPESRRAGEEKSDPPNSRQFRVTVRVTGPKGTQTWVQSLLTKG